MGNGSGRPNNDNPATASRNKLSRVPITRANKPRWVQAASRVCRVFTQLAQRTREGLGAEQIEDLGETGKKVHNVIDARFTFRDGLIATHHDTFDLRAWMAQAMGVTGVLLGWLPPVQNALRRKAREGLDQWRAKRA